MPATYKLTLHSGHDASGNEFINVFGYHDQLALPVAMDQLVDGFIDQICPAINAVLNVNSFMRRIECEQIIGGTAYIDRLLVPELGGSRSGQYLPQFNAWGFDYRRANIGERSGAKRFGMISESDVTDGSATTDIQADLNTLATQLGDPITIGLVDTWFPVILERPVPPATAWGFHDLSGVQYKRVTTQNSRKR